MMNSRYEFEQSVEEDFLFCEFLAGRARAADIYRKVDDVIISNEIKCQNCADGAAAMTGKHGEFLPELKKYHQNQGSHIAIYIFS